jgi:hypothetical protein
VRQWFFAALIIAFAHFIFKGMGDFFISVKKHKFSSVIFYQTFNNQLMRNFKQLLYLLFFVTLIFTSCTKENNVSSTETNNQQTSNANAVSQSITYNNITIDVSRSHVFSVPYITQAVIDKGSVSVYATYGSETSQWNALPIINSCDSRLEISSVTVGNVEIQNTLGTSVSMSFRFDIAAN